MNWINFKEQKPTKFGKYLVCYEDVFCNAVDVCVWKPDIEQFVWDDPENIINDSVIAWMPLPEAVR